MASRKEAPQMLTIDEIRKRRAAVGAKAQLEMLAKKKAIPAQAARPTAPDAALNLLPHLDPTVASPPLPNGALTSLQTSSTFPPPPKSTDNAVSFATPTQAYSNPPLHPVINNTPHAPRAPPLSASNELPVQHTVPDHEQISSEQFIPAANGAAIPDSIDEPAGSQPHDEDLQHTTDVHIVCISVGAAAWHQLVTGNCVNTARQGTVTTNASSAEGDGI